MHGGNITVDSLGENQGSTFTVKLPLLITKNPGSLVTTVGNMPEPDPQPLFISLADVKVLVVDDEDDCRAFMVTILEQCQAEVQSVGSVSEALQIIAQNPPDVLISDICMPGEDGYSLIRKLRSQSPEQGGKIPAAALTGQVHTEDRLKAMQSGYQLYLPKPIEPAELITVVAILIANKSVESPS
jgi:CheY-like chemotaxis protein